MTRRSIIAFAVVGSLLLVTAPAGAVTKTSLFDGFEDGTATDDWSSPTGDSISTVTNGLQYSGSHAMNFTNGSAGLGGGIGVDNATSYAVWDSTSGNIGAQNNITAKLNATESDGFDGLAYLNETSGVGYIAVVRINFSLSFDLIEIYRVKPDGSTAFLDGVTTSAEINKGEYYTMEFRRNGTTGEMTALLRNSSYTFPEVNATDTTLSNMTAAGATTQKTAFYDNVMFNSSRAAPEIDNSSASPTGGINDRDVTFEVNVSDGDFPNDQVGVEFFHKGPNENSFSSLGTDTLTANGTATLTEQFSTGGTHEWYVWANDSYGGEVRSDSDTNTAGNQTFSFSIPVNVTVREELPGHDKIDDRPVELTFFEQLDDDPTIINRTTNDGNITLTGLPVGSAFVVKIEARGYHNRTILVDSIFDQESVFLLHKNVTAVENRFVVDDRTGDFPAGETQLVVQKAINRSLYNGTPGDFSWTNIGGDELGADKSYVVDLEKEGRYRIRVRNQANETRILGAYAAEQNGTIELEIGSVVLDPTGDAQPTFIANRTNVTGQPVRVNFEYNDSNVTTERIYLEIYEFQNESNQLQANTSFIGPFGQFSFTKDVPASENDTTWVVDFRAERTDAPAITGRIVVGQEQRPVSVCMALPAWLRTIISVGTIWLVAALFSQLNGHIGAIAVAGVGGMLWFIDCTPTALGGGVVVLAMVMAGVVFVNGQRGGGV